jgi:hypothetical protein
MSNSCPVRDTVEVRRGIAGKIPCTVVSTRRKQSVSTGQSWIVHALSWLGGWIQEECAMHAEPVYPNLVFPKASNTWTNAAHWSAAASLPSRKHSRAHAARMSHDIDIGAWLASARPALQRDRLGWLRFAPVWPQRRARASKRSSSRRLFDQTRRDRYSAAGACPVSEINLR